MSGTTPKLLLLAAALALAGCATTGSAASGTASEDAFDRPQIVVTTSILGDLVVQLVGDDAEVEVLLGPGSDPHSSSLSAAQATALRDADLVVANGLGLEEGMLDALESAEEDGANVWHAIDPVETIEAAEGAHADEDEEAHSEEEAHGHEGGADPHFWMDPARTATSVTALAEEVAAVDDALADEEWAARAEALVADLEALDAEITGILDAVPAEQRVLVTSHEAFGYFADAYDFEVVGTIVPGGSTLAEPSAVDLTELVEAIEAEDVPAIFVESIDASALAEVVAAEVGRDVEVGVLYSDSLSDADGPAATYADYMRYNATTIADLLTP